MFYFYSFSTSRYAIAFHPDGSLLASGDLGGTGRIWDLRMYCILYMIFIIE
jgi:WD40 repeat protein